MPRRSPRANCRVDRRRLTAALIASGGVAALIASGEIRDDPTPWFLYAAHRRYSIPIKEWNKIIEVNVPGGRIVGEVSGAGAPVVLLHAGVADRRMWNPIVPALERSNTLARFDFRGYGESPVSTAPFVPRDDLLAVLDHLALDRAALVGSSFGAIVAMEAALSDPGRVAALILLAPGLPGRDWSTQMLEYFEAEERAIEAADVDAVIDLDLDIWVRGPARAWSDPVRAVANELRDQLRVLATNQIAGADHEVSAEPPIQDCLHLLDVPTLVAIAEADPGDIVAAGDYIAANVPGARSVRFADTGHLLAMERPEQTVELVTGFLRELDVS